MKPAAEVIRQASSSWTENKYEGQKNNDFSKQFLPLSFLYMTEEKLSGAGKARGSCHSLIQLFEKEL